MFQNHPNITRKLLTGFMEFFSYIELERYTNSFSQRKIQKVPIQYCPTDKWYQIYNSSSARKNMNLDTNIAPVEMQWILPRLSVSLINIIYDTDRHLNKTRHLPYDNIVNNTASLQRVGVPYNLEIELSSISKNMDDAFQVMEQIIPFFSPSISIDVNILESSESVPITLNSVNFDFPQETSEEEEKFFIITYGFTMRANYYLKKSETPTPVITGSNFNITSPIIDNNLPLNIDTSNTLFAQYVANSYNPNPLDGNTFHDYDQVNLISKGSWITDSVYTNFDYVIHGTNKFIWIGGNLPNIEPGQPNWESCWTLLSVVINSSINIHIDDNIKEEFAIENTII